MGSHPLNLGLRFLLELTALLAVGLWGWRQSEGWMRYNYGIGIPTLLAAIWVVFAVPEDPSRSGAAPIVTPGVIRLFIEFCFFSFATWSLYSIHFERASLLFGILVIVHYAASYDRVLWLLKL